MTFKLLKTPFIELTTYMDRRLYKGKDFVIISNNCWGAEIYRRLGVRYNTPFVGLFLFGPDYIKLLENFDYYMNCNLTFKTSSDFVGNDIPYPIGQLGDLEIHFQHYKNEDEAQDKWKRRLDRMKMVPNKDNYFIKICDRDKGDESIFKRFHQLPFSNKISFGVNAFNNINHIHIEGEVKDKFVPDGIELYRISYKYLDLLEWFNTKQRTSNYYSKFKYYLKLV